MKILFVIHDFSLTGAPKLGLQLAEEFARFHDVTLVSKKDGPLRDLISPGIFRDVVVTETSHEISRVSLRERISDAVKVMNTIKPDLVYANSVASAEWIDAAIEYNCPSVLHIHEMMSALLELKKMGIYNDSSVANADFIVTASSESLRDTALLFDVSEEKIFNFGVCVDINRVKVSAEIDPGMALRHDGAELQFHRQDHSNRRKVIAMCGLAQIRKGADLFWHAARLMPEYDFLWIGPWNDGFAMSANPALALNAEKPLDNLYWSNSTSNPYAFMANSDLFVLTSREDPNPLVIPEAICLGLPVVTFASTGGSYFWTTRFGFSLSGKVDVDRIVKFIRRFFSFPHVHCDVKSAFIEMADLQVRAGKLMELIERTVKNKKLEIVGGNV